MSEETKKSNRQKAYNDLEGSIFEYQKEVRQPNGKLKTVTLYKVRKRYSIPVFDERGNPVLNERGKQVLKHREKKKLDIPSKTEALSVRRQFLDEIEDEINKAGQIENQSDQYTFFRLLDEYEKDYVVEARFDGSVKVEGFRERLDQIKRVLKIFREFFGDCKLEEITYQRLAEFRRVRLAAKVVKVRKKKIELTDADRKKLKTKATYRIEKIETLSQRRVASVHRELARLRRILNIAVQNRKIPINPFALGDSLISQASETERVRMLTFEEEKRLLAVCTDKRDILRRVIICALDTAMRQGEIFKLRWRDVDLENRVIYLQSLNTKTLRDRTAPVTSRLKRELEDLRENTFENGDDDLVFGIKTSCKVAWYLALRDAGIEGLRFHDLRGTAITRMLQAGMSAPEVMKISGHSQFKTFLRYTKNVKETVQRAGHALDALLEQNPAA